MSLLPDLVSNTASYVNRTDRNAMNLTSRSWHRGILIYYRNLARKYSNHPRLGLVDEEERARYLHRAHLPGFDDIPLELFPFQSEYTYQPLEGSLVVEGQVGQAPAQTVVPYQSHRELYYLVITAQGESFVIVATDPQNWIPTTIPIVEISGKVGLTEAGEIACFSGDATEEALEEENFILIDPDYIPAQKLFWIDHGQMELFLAHMSDDSWFLFLLDGATVVDETEVTPSMTKPIADISYPIILYQDGTIARLDIQEEPLGLTIEPVMFDPVIALHRSNPIIVDRDDSYQETALVTEDGDLWRFVYRPGIGQSIARYSNYRVLNCPVVSEDLTYYIRY